MKRIFLTAPLIILPFYSQAQTAVTDIVDGHILPRFEALAAATATLADVAANDCNPTSEALRNAYGAAFDAWVSASHLRFGPTEVDDRAFALAFWPDSRGATPRTLAILIEDEDPIGTSSESYGAVSIAARGFYAFEFLLHDERLRTSGRPAYHCTLTQTLADDMATTASAILHDWETEFADTLLNPGPGAIYQTEQEVLQELFKALSTGLQFTSDTRLGRPLGTFNRPRPNRAEARRSGRSALHVGLSLTALHDLGTYLTTPDADLTDRLSGQFADAIERLEALNDPVFIGVSNPQARFKVEVIKQAVDSIRETVAQDLGPRLGVVAGFNSLDGD